MSSTHPYAEPSTNVLYQLLFCDDPGLFKKSMQAPYAYPWSVLLNEDAVLDELQKVRNDADLESRVQLLAAHALREQQLVQKDAQLLGVIVEIGLEHGLDVLAAYRDGTARYINYTGRVIIWDLQDATAMAISKELFEASEKIVAQIGPWDQPRRPAPTTGNLRISFLMTDGLYFGEGPIDVLFGDPLAAPALQAATRLLQHITAFSENSEKH